MSNYGSTEGHNIPPDNLEVYSPTSRKSKTRDLLARPWIRVAILLSIIAFLTVFVKKEGHPSTSSSPSTKTATSKNLHDENEELFYDEQLVNHFPSEDTADEDAATWSNRYYKSINYFEGPGHPIFLVVGGEGALDSGMLYPFVTKHLAPRFGAAVVQIEHRFYGKESCIVYIFKYSILSFFVILCLVHILQTLRVPFY